ALTEAKIGASQGGPRHCGHARYAFARGGDNAHPATLANKVVWCGVLLSRSRGDGTMQSHIRQRTGVSLDEASDGPSAESQGRHAFDPVIKSAHWLTLLLIIFLFSTAALAEAGVSEAAKLILIQLHRSFGLTLWTITILRLTWRQFAEFPDWPPDMPH